MESKKKEKKSEKQPRLFHEPSVILIPRLDKDNTRKEIIVPYYL